MIQQLGLSGGSQNMAPVSTNTLFGSAKGGESVYEEHIKPLLPRQGEAALGSPASGGSGRANRPTLWNRRIAMLENCELLWDRFYGNSVSNGYRNINNQWSGGYKTLELV